MKTVLLVIAGLVAASVGFAQQRSYNTTKALLEINDPKAQRNPVRSVAASNWRASEARDKLKPRPGQDVAVVCEGKFPAGYIADDLYGQGGFNRRLVVSKETTILEICNQMEDDLRKTNPKMFK